MVTDTLANASIYFPLSPRIEAALRFLQQPQLPSLQLGKHAIDGDRIFALIQEYETRPPEQCFWEAHRQYIDVQFVASGVEAIGWSPIQSMRVSQEYDPQRDLVVLQGSGQPIELVANSFAIFYPHDAHMPCMAASQSQTVRKIVVKVAVA